MGYAKQAIDGGLDGSLADGLDLEADLFVEVFGTDDANDRCRSFLERRPGQAVFRGRCIRDSAQAPLDASAAGAAGSPARSARAPAGRPARRAAPPIHHGNVSASSQQKSVRPPASGAAGTGPGR